MSYVTAKFKPMRISRFQIFSSTDIPWWWSDATERLQQISVLNTLIQQIERDWLELGKLHRIKPTGNRWYTLFYKTK
jgi:hypothetical protein